MSKQLNLFDRTPNKLKCSISEMAQINDICRAYYHYNFGRDIAWCYTFPWTGERKKIRWQFWKS